MTSSDAGWMSPWHIRTRLAQPAANADVQMEIEAEMLVGVPGAPGENPFLPAAANPVSRISFNIGRDSYEKVRAGVNSGTKPPRDAVRLEQLINNFSYDYAVPALNENFSIHVASGACPWQPQHRLVRVAVKARKVARQVQLVASFNPDSTSTYRLLGYEDRSPSSDATGETVTAGQTLTALYEVEPTANQPSPLAPLLSVSLSYYSPTGSAKLVAQNSSIEDFGDDNRAGIERTLHRGVLGDVKSLAFMLNGYWDFPLSGWAPYLGLGLGISSNTVGTMSATARPSRTCASALRYK
jgi:hypothetical protein